jgi:hypothetical protein
VSLYDDIIGTLFFSATPRADATFLNQGNLSGECLVCNADGALALADRHLARFTLKGRQTAFYHGAKNLSANLRQVLGGIFGGTLSDLCLHNGAINPHIKGFARKGNIRDGVDGVHCDFKVSSENVGGSGLGHVGVVIDYPSILQVPWRHRTPQRCDCYKGSQRMKKYKQSTTIAIESINNQE